MVERVLVRKKKNGVFIGCPKDIADKYVASGVVEIIPVSPLSNGYHAISTEHAHKGVYYGSSAISFGGC